MSYILQVENYFSIVKLVTQGETTNRTYCKTISYQNYTDHKSFYNLLYTSTSSPCYPDLSPTFSLLCLR